MRLIDSASTRQALPFHLLVPALKASFAKGCETPARHVHEINIPVVDPAADPLGRRMTSLIMPAWLPGSYYGVKVVNIAPGNASAGLQGLHGSYLLFDARTGVPLACIDGDEMTARRTAAASALAASFLAKETSKHLLVVGGGRVASLLPMAYRTVRPIERVSVWTRREEATAHLVGLFRSQGFDAQVADSLEGSCAEADVISCATLSTEPLVRGSWLSPGSHLDLIGSFTPAMREADDACFLDARVFVDTDEALKKSGDLISPLKSGALREEEVRGTLTTLCRGVATGRRSGTERTVFKSVGTALEDLAAAILVYEQGQPAEKE